MKKILKRDGVFGFTEMQFDKNRVNCFWWDGESDYDWLEDDHYECGCCMCCGCMCDWNDLYDE